MLATDGRGEPFRLSRQATYRNAADLASVPLACDILAARRRCASQQRALLDLAHGTTITNLSIVVWCRAREGVLRVWKQASSTVSTSHSN